MINGIYGSNSWANGVFNRNSIGYYSNIASMNDAKLSQILAGKTGGGNKTGSLSGTSTSFLKGYQANMTDMMTKANSMRSLNEKNSYQTLDVSSSDTAVLEADSYFKMSQAASYDINVQQLAASQVNTSQEYNAGDAASLSGQLTIATNSKTLNINVDSLSGTTNAEKLNALAKEVNRYQAGVTASVVNNNGKVSLQLKSSETGTGNGFIASGSFASGNGLSNVQQAAQNAKYTVDGQQHTSSSNTVDVGGYKIYATLKKTGSAKISVAPNVDETTKKVQDLVDSFNGTLKFLNDNSEMGKGVIKQLTRMVVPPTSERSLKTIGITIAKDGSLKMDQATFKDALKRSPNLVNDVVSGSHGLAEGIYADARAGMNASSASLISSEIAKTQSFSMSNSLDMMSSYSKSGAYNMLNYYAVSSMMNFYI